MRSKKSLIGSEHEPLSEANPDGLACLFLLLFTLLAWQTIRFHSVEAYLAYLRSAQDAYRLTWYPFAFLDGMLFSIFTWMGLFFFTVAFCCYYLIRPQGKDYWIFLLWFAFLPKFDHALQLLLLVFLAKYRHKWFSPLFLLLLAPVKELAVWLGTGYLWLTKSRPWWQVILGASLAAALYLIIRTWIGERSYYVDAPGLVTPPAMLKFLFSQSVPGIYLIFQIGLLVVLFWLTVDQAWEWKLVLWNLAPVVLFAFVWESQLWLPVALMILAHRSEDSPVERLTFSEFDVEKTL
ncbi:MAG: hypothetical protein ACE5OZ_12110 [Candidatus Heimdallarchaeota archaeon]